MSDKNVDQTIWVVKNVGLNHRGCSVITYKSDANIEKAYFYTLSNIIVKITVF